MSQLSAFSQLHLAMSVAPALSSEVCERWEGEREWSERCARAIMFLARANSCCLFYVVGSLGVEVAVVAVEVVVRWRLHSLLRCAVVARGTKSLLWPPSVVDRHSPRTWAPASLGHRTSGPFVALSIWQATWTSLQYSRMEFC